MDTLAGASAGADDLISWLSPQANSDAIANDSQEKTGQDELVEQRRARKRMTDRVAQRQHRKRQKLYIEELEDQIRQLKGAGQSNVAQVVAQNLKLQEEIREMNNLWDEMEQILQRQRRLRQRSVMNNNHVDGQVSFQSAGFTPKDMHHENGTIATTIHPRKSPPASPCLILDPLMDANHEQTIEQEHTFPGLTPEHDCHGASSMIDPLALNAMDEFTATDFQDGTHIETEQLRSVDSNAEDRPPALPSGAPNHRHSEINRTDLSHRTSTAFLDDVAHLSPDLDSFMLNILPYSISDAQNHIQMHTYPTEAKQRSHDLPTTEDTTNNSIRQPESRPFQSQSTQRSSHALVPVAQASLNEAIGHSLAQRDTLQSSSRESIANILEILGSYIEHWTRPPVPFSISTITSHQAQRLPLVRVPPLPEDKELHNLLERARQNAQFIGPPSLVDFLFDNPRNTLSVDLKALLAPVRLIRRTSEFLATYWVLYLLLRWHIVRSHEAYQMLPDWMRPTQMQLTVLHPVAADLVVWPEIREGLIRMSLSDEVGLYDVSVNIIRHLTVEVHATNHTMLSDPKELESAILDLRNWKLSSAFFDRYPQWKSSSTSVIAC